MLDHINALLDDDVTDVFISASSGVWVQRGAVGSRSTLELTEAQTRELAVRLVDWGGRHIDDASPCVDVRLDGGVRVHAALAPVSVRGTEISIRLPTRSVSTLRDWVSSGGMSRDVCERLQRSVAMRETLLISGATGAGKTALLACLMSEAPGEQRIITIEDVAELQIEHPRVVGLEARQPNTDGRGEISIAELVRQSLRMRPERLVVGECRGPEVVDMLRAFTTGHSGGGSTIHANSLGDVAVRLDSLAALAGMSSSALARLAHAAIDLIVHIDVVEGIRQVSLATLVVRDDVLVAVPLGALHA